MHTPIFNDVYMICGLSYEIFMLLMLHRKATFETFSSTLDIEIRWMWGMYIYIYIYIYIPRKLAQSWCFQVNIALKVRSHAKHRLAQSWYFKWISFLKFDLMPNIAPKRMYIQNPKLLVTLYVFIGCYLYMCYSYNPLIFHLHSCMRSNRYITNITRDWIQLDINSWLMRFWYWFSMNSTFDIKTISQPMWNIHIY